MKQVLAALVTVLAVAAGSTIAAGPALADQPTYVPAKPTRSSAAPAHPVVTTHQHPQIVFQVRTVGNAKKPHGTVHIVVLNGKGQVVKVHNERYHTWHPRRPYTLPTFPANHKGKHYTVKMTFTGKGFKKTHDTTQFVVKRHR